MKCLSNLNDHERHGMLPLARPASPSQYTFLRRDKKDYKNKINQNEILDEYQDLNYYINYDETLKKKKLIKIQDGTDWLAFKNKIHHSSNQYIKSSMNNSTNIYRHYSANIQKANLPIQSNSFYFQTNNDVDLNLNISQQHLYRINMLLNRKSSRANT